MTTQPPGRTDVLPPVMRAGMHWWAGLSVLFAVAAVLWVILLEPLALPRTGVHRYVPLALGLVPVLMLPPVWLWRARGIRRALRSSDGRLCRTPLHALRLQRVGPARYERVRSAATV